MAVRERLRVGQLVGVEEEDRHNVGETDRLGVEVPVRDTVAVTGVEPDVVSDEV